MVESQQPTTTWTGVSAELSHNNYLSCCPWCVPNRLGDAMTNRGITDNLKSFTSLLR